MENTHIPSGLYEKYIKRPMDVILSMAALAALSPLMAVIAVTVRIKLGSPIIFIQKRPGKNGKIFNNYKFRTMTEERDGNGNLLPDDVRLTSFGKKLRETSLDELPELFNIIKGDMSLIGFRPPLTYHPWPIEQYTEEQMKMFSVRPGVTGWAQVHGRKEVQWADRIEMGIWYAEHVSFLLDLKILILTVIKVLTNANNENTVLTTGNGTIEKK